MTLNLSCEKFLILLAHLHPSKQPFPAIFGQTGGSLYPSQSHCFVVVNELINSGEQFGPTIPLVGELYKLYAFIQLRNRSAISAVKLCVHLVYAAVERLNPTVNRVLTISNEFVRDAVGALD
jgi:hypothetical protein